METTKRQPSTAAASTAYLDGAGHKAHMHVGVSITILFMFVVSAAQIWQDLGRWQDMIIAGIVFLYFAVMMNLLLIKRRNDKRRELEGYDWIIRRPELTPMLMSVATVVMPVSLGVAVFIFRPYWLDLAEIAFCISASTAMMFLVLKIAELEEKKWLKEKRQDASDQV